MESKTDFRGAYRLSGTEIVECSKVVDARCNLKQFDGLTWQPLVSSVATFPPNVVKIDRVVLCTMLLTDKRRRKQPPWRT